MSLKKWKKSRRVYCNWKEDFSNKQQVGFLITNHRTLSGITSLQFYRLYSFGFRMGGWSSFKSVSVQLGLRGFSTWMIPTFPWTDLVVRTQRGIRYISKSLLSTGISSGFHPTYSQRFTVYNIPISGWIFNPVSKRKDLRGSNILFPTYVPWDLVLIFYGRLGSGREFVVGRFRLTRSGLGRNR